jgi:hypothetical protein
MSLFLKEELTVAGHNLIVKERIAEGGFGFVDLVASPQTGQEFVVCHTLYSPALQKQHWLETVSRMRNEVIQCKDIERHSRGKPLT